GPRPPTVNDQCRARRQRGQQVLGAPRQRHNGLIHKPGAEAPRKRHAQVGPPDLDVSDPRLCQKRREAPAHGLDFGKLRQRFRISAIAWLRIAATRMRELEALIGLVLAAVVLAAAARRVGAPYPVFLAVGGALLAFVPAVPTLTVGPGRARGLFVAPVLLDAAYDASPRDLRDNWVPVTGLVVGAGGLTTTPAARGARPPVSARPCARR